MNFYFEIWVKILTQYTKWCTISQKRIYMPKVQTSLRLEEETFNEAKEILKSLGMNFTEAVNIFASMVVQERGLPFDVVASEYPAITYEEAQEKVKRSIEGIAESKGVPSDDFFTKLLTK
jgi:DNA-damage-inducible protein J